MDGFNVKTRKIIHLTGTKLSPEVVLARTLEKAKRMKGVFIVVQWDDFTFDMDWSQVSVSELCMAGKIFDRHVDQVLDEHRED